MPNPSTTPADVIVALLNAHASLISGTNLFSMPPRPESTLIPRNCVFVWEQFSFLPHTYIGVDKDDRQFIVDTLLRYQDPFVTGRTLAYEFWLLIQRADLSSYTGYVSSLTRDSGPRYIGVDDTDNHRFVITTNLRYVG